MFRRLLGWLKKPSRTLSVGLLLVIGGLGGVIFWGGFNTYMEYTNTEAFCTSCHEMRQLVYPEYQESVHFQNAAGVRATPIAPSPTSPRGAATPSSASCPHFPLKNRPSPM